MAGDPSSNPVRTEDGRIVGMDGGRGDSGLRRQLGSLVDHPWLDDWVSIENNGRVTVRTGKVELGQGIRTALTLLAAEELCLDAAQVDVAAATTGLSPDEGFTAGSRSVEQSGAAVRQACAHARRILVSRASSRFGVVADELHVAGGCVRAPDGRSVSYGELAAGAPFAYRVTAPADLRPPELHRWIGHGMRRVDLSQKILGYPVYVQDLRLPGMCFARVLRPVRSGSTLTAPPPDSVAGAKVVRQGSFVAVVASSEGAAAAAAERLRPLLAWTGGLTFPDQLDDPDYMVAHVVASYPILEGMAVEEEPPKLPVLPSGPPTRQARYTRSFLLHGSIGPSGAVACFDAGSLTVWSHSQGVGFLRKAIAGVVGLSDEQVTVHHMDGAGCYGHNGADDAALDASLVAMAVPGRPVSLRWSRSDEHGGEPLGPAMVIDLAADLDADGHMENWRQDILTYRHNARPIPTPSGTRLASGWALEPPIERSRAAPMLDFEAGGHRNATPSYRLGSSVIVKHDVDDGSPLRTSSLRGLGAPVNVFAIESFVEEMAAAAGADPVTFRLAHLDDPRSRAVVEAAVSMAGGLQAPGGLEAPGRGLGFAQYENSMTYAAVVVELEVSPRTGAIMLRHGWIAADAGEVIDPDGLVNQLEGGFVQAASWTLLESVGFDADGVSTRDWESYPIMRFSQVPELTTRLIDRPGSRSLGAGEAAVGPTVAAIANAVFQHTGARLRSLPLSAPRVLAALEELL